MNLLRRLTPHAWIVSLAAALAFLAVDSAHRIEHIQTLTATPGAIVQSPATAPASPTGYLSNQRSLLLPTFAADGYHWIMQTQQMLAAGEPRVRTVMYDNAPDGRAVHWASPFRWWLGLLAWSDHLITGLPLGLAVERTALYANPLLLAVLLLTLTPLTARRFGPVAAALLALGLVASPPLYDYFVAGYPDHHGMAAACALIALLGVLLGGAGWTPADPTRQTRARRWFAFSAIGGAIGLWISAASLAPILVSIGIGAFVAARLGKRLSTSDAARPDPSVWRFWARCGAATSFFAYLIEYFPNHLGWRLEVNHPLYALAWLGAGELLARWWESPSFSGLFKTASGTRATLLAMTALGLLPCVVLLTKARTFHVADPFLWELHHEYIAEFQSMASYLARNGVDFAFIAACVPFLLLVPAGRALLRRKGDSHIRAGLSVALLPVLVSLLLALNEIRWFGFFHAALLAALVYTAGLQRVTALWPPRLWRLALAVTLLPIPLAALQRASQVNERRTVLTRTEVQQIALRDLAHWLRRRVGAQPAVIVTSPTLATPLIFHSGLATTGTLYWENRDGLRTTAGLFAARSAAEARRLVATHGITHLVFASWNDFTASYTRLARGLPKSAGVPDDAFVLTLLRTKVCPPWLRAVAVQLPENPELKQESVFIFEVVEPQSLEESLVRMASFLLDSKQTQTAARFLPALQRYPDFLPALLVQARIQRQLQQAAPFRETIRQILARSDRFAGLALEDRVQLMTLLAAIRDEPGARRECETSWRQAQADEGALRKLPAGALADLLGQSQRLSVSMPAELQHLTRSLLPPQWLSEL